MVQIRNDRVVVSEDDDDDEDTDTSLEEGSDEDMEEEGQEGRGVGATRQVRIHGNGSGLALTTAAAHTQRPRALDRVSAPHIQILVDLMFTTRGERAHARDDFLAIPIRHQPFHPTCSPHGRIHMLFPSHIFDQPAAPPPHRRQWVTVPWIGSAIGVHQLLRPLLLPKRDR